MRDTLAYRNFLLSVEQRTDGFKAQVTKLIEMDLNVPAGEILANREISTLLRITNEVERTLRQAKTELTTNGGRQ